jgi:DNA-directed RNA polymerase subunit RPC12/RpoP
MSYFAEFDGKIFVEQGDPDPLRCPDCRRIFPSSPTLKDGDKLRCPGCSYDGRAEAFKAKFVGLCECRVLAAL